MDVKVVVHESPNMLRYDDFICPECGEMYLEELWRRSEGPPACPLCKTPMAPLPGGVYQMSQEDWNAAHRPSGLNWKADAATRAAVIKGVERRKQRLGGTGSL